MSGGYILFKSKMKALLRALPVLLLATLAFTATVAPVSALGGTWSLGAINGVYQDVVTVTGSGFSATNPYTITFDGAAVGSGTTDSSGNIAGYFVVPPAARGAHSVTIVSSGDTTDTKQFAVGPKVLVSPTQGAVGQDMAVQGYGFAAFAAVTVHFDSPTNPTLAQATTTANGTFTTTAFNVPATTAGSHFVFAKETSGSVYAYANFIVNAGISLSASTGKVGDTVTVTGGGFTAGGSVNLYFDTVHEDNLLTTVTANSATSSTPGAISTTITIPEAGRGNHNIIARDMSSTNNTPPKAFAVTPKITVNPTTGAVGSSVTVTGSGFSANTSVSFEWDGSAISGVTAVTTNATGGFTKTFTVPAATSGEHTITARDATGPAEATYTVATKIGFGPDQATSISGVINGTNVSVSGSGFQAGATISFHYGTIPLTTNATVQSNGTFNPVQITVPGGLAKDHNLIATDGQGNSATATISTTTEFDYTPKTTPGHVGQEITVTGNGFYPGSAISVKIDNDTIASGSASATTGAFEISFNIPAMSAGSYTITVSDDVPSSTQNNVKTFTFVMEGDAPEAPELVTPDGVDKPKQPIVYEWGDVTDDSGVTYTLEVFTTPELNVLILKKEGLTTSSYTATEEEKLPSVSKDAPYYWRVTATDGAGNVGTPAEPISFTVGFSWDDIFPDDVPTWAWITIGVLVVLIIGGLIYYFWRRSYSY
jgi:hypothetical protein